MAAKTYRHEYQPAEDIITVRIPILGSPGNRATSSSKDQRFVNGYFSQLKNPLTGKTAFFFLKRPGFSQNIRPPAANAVGRGLYSWKSSIYSVFGTQIYKGTTNLGVTMSTSTGICGFAETRPGAATEYLGINDGTDLYLVDASGNVIVLNNKTITSSSVANPSVITATAHGLTTGNRIVIRNHTGSTPDINGTIYTVTVTGANTFTIPVNVTVGGSNGTIGVFPTPNTGDLLYADGYLFVLKGSTVALYNCEVDDPTTWDSTKFITAQMFNGLGIGIAKQNNLILAFCDKSVQAFYNNANATGSPFSNYESAVQQIGSRSNNAIVEDESMITWVGNSFLGGHTVWMLQGITGLKEIATEQVRVLLDAEGAQLANTRARMLRSAGKKFYILTLATANRTLVYDYELEFWTEFEAAAGSDNWPILSTYEHADTLIGQHESNGWIYTISPTVYQDDSVNFTVLARFGRMDLDTNRRKFVRSYELLGDKQTSTTNVSFQYSDDDYVTLSTARTFDMSATRPLLTRGGSFRRRAHQLSYTGSGPLRLEGLEMRYRLGDS